MLFSLFSLPEPMLYHKALVNKTQRRRRRLFFEHKNLRTCEHRETLCVFKTAKKYPPLHGWWCRTSDSSTLDRHWRFIPKDVLHIVNIDFDRILNYNNVKWTVRNRKVNYIYAYELYLFSCWTLGIMDLPPSGQRPVYISHDMTLSTGACVYLK